MNTKREADNYGFNEYILLKKQQDIKKKHNLHYHRGVPLYTILQV